MARALESLKNFHVNGLLLNKVYTVWVKKVQRDNLSWNWRGIQNLEPNRLVVSKLASEIWLILIWALQKSENFFVLIGLLWPKNILFELQRDELSFMTLRSYANFEEKLGEESTCHFKIDIRNLTSFDPSTSKVYKNFCFNWVLVTKKYIVWATKVQTSYLSWHWGVMQILKKNWLVVWKKTWEFGKFSPEHLKVSKLEHWWGPFVQSRNDLRI